MKKLILFLVLGLILTLPTSNVFAQKGQNNSEERKTEAIFQNESCYNCICVATDKYKYARGDSVILMRITIPNYDHLDSVKLSVHHQAERGAYESWSKTGSRDLWSFTALDSLSLVVSFIYEWDMVGYKGHINCGRYSLKCEIFLPVGSLFSCVDFFVLPHTGVNPEEKNIPNGFSLEQNYPNPFNPTTQISFTLPENSLVNLKIYNITGQLIKSFDGYYPPGTHTITWDGTNLNGENVGSGIYFYKLETEKIKQTKKMLLIK